MAGFTGVAQRPSSRSALLALCTALVSSMALAPPASANDEPADSPDQEVWEDRFSVGAFVGWKLLSDELELGNSVLNDEVPESGPLFGIRSSFVILPALAPTSTFAPRLLAEVEATFTVSNTGLDTDSNILGWRAHALVDFAAPQAFQPFLLLGVGGETLLNSGISGGDASDTDAALIWGTGARIRIKRGFLVRADYRQIITAGRFDYASINHEFHLGVEFAFTTHKREEAIPMAPPPTPVAAAPTGPADTDKDGISDDVDKCPNQPELINEIDDEDGCPEVDSDGDGLLGSADKCPAKAEDMDGFEDGDGCPELDNDNDGVQDARDKCPLKPETKNGFEDDDGCPDELPKEVQQFTGRIEGIRFASGRSTILRSSHRMLNNAVKILKQYPSVRLEISGHTDIRGKRESNMKLSRARADAVKWYLVDKGVESSRLVTIGHGPDKPIADNKSRKGRAENRRIEFRILLAGEGETTTSPTPAP